MTFPSVEAYRDFWRAHPAFASGPFTDDVADFVDYDLGHLSSTPRASRATGRESRRTPSGPTGGPCSTATTAARPSTPWPTPAVLLWAARGLQNEERPLLPAEAIADAQALLPHLVVREVPDTNHYFILLGDREAGVVAEEIRRRAPATS